MPKSSVNASLSSYDDIFSTEESRQEEQREQVQQIPIGELFPFKNHPFKVLDDDSMSDTVESVKQYGVLSPLIARPRPKGGYEIISGHRRQHAAELAGLETLPVIVRQMDDDAAIILMVDSNLQREHILPSERAFAYKMKLDAMKNQGTRSDLTSTQVVSKLRSNEKLGAENNQSRETVRRFIRLTNLIPELLDMVDNKTVSFNPAVELSYLSPEQQQEVIRAIRNERSVRSTAEAENRLPLNIHGKSLLAGNAYCGHCGAKLELTSSRKWRKMADGSLDDTLRIRYTCYGKLRKQTNCTGQTGYTVHILDEIIDKAVRQIFSKMRGIPKEQIVTKRYEKENAERKNHLQDLQTQRNKAEKDLLALKTEVLACIKGESVLPRETLAEMITAQEEKLTELENLCEAASEELEKTAELMDKVSRLYDELISYADLYDSANFEAKKMIVNQLIRRVDVYRGYQINISFNFDLTPYIEGE
ncbi:MAG: ParB/RepB/Spo0J family partition protein [Faecalibacterium prausnitzii]|nr:ParB/RepB/Spo0J family partition protein [Faecalibacterium prausnitzii]